MDSSAQTPRAQGPRLFRRLQDHKRAIANVDNLESSDFDCRFLVVQSGWQATAGSYLIAMFKPLWNNEGEIAS
jgi:hypothetical protein